MMTVAQVKMISDSTIEFENNIGKILFTLHSCSMNEQEKYILYIYETNTTQKHVRQREKRESEILFKARRTICHCESQ